MGWGPGLVCLTPGYCGTVSGVTRSAEMMPSLKNKI